MGLLILKQNTVRAQNYFITEILKKVALDTLQTGSINSISEFRSWVTLICIKDVEYIKVFFETALVLNRIAGLNLFREADTGSMEEGIIGVKVQ